jgi:CDP-6-deoxy-D-xylo-4-hexulose-3-dehydrase
MQAAIGVAQLKKLPEFIKKRNYNWKVFYENFKKYENYFILPKPISKSSPSWFGFILTIKKAPFTRNEIINFLEKKKIATRLLFAGNIIKQPCFEGIKYRVYGDLKNTDLIMKNSFWIGVYPGLSEEMIEYIINSFNEFLNLQALK